MEGMIDVVWWENTEIKHLKSRVVNLHTSKSHLELLFHSLEGCEASKQLTQSSCKNF